MKKSLLNIGFSLLMLLFVSPLLSQVQLDEVTVVASAGQDKITVSMDSVEAGDDITKILSFSVPVFIKNYGPGQLLTVAFRGLQATHTSVLWNGFDLASPSLGQTDFSLVPACFFDEADVSLGGASLDTRPGAPAGLINLNASKLDRGEVSVFRGSFSTTKLCAKIPLALNNTDLQFRVFADNSVNDYPYTNSYNPALATERMQNADYHSLGMVVYLRSRVNKSFRWGLDLWSYAKKRDLPPPLSYEGAGRLEWQRDFDNRAVLWLKSKKITLRLGASYDSIHYYLADRITESDFFVRNNSKSVSGIVNTDLIYVLKNIEFKFNFAGQYLRLYDTNAINVTEIAVMRPVSNMSFLYSYARNSSKMELMAGVGSDTARLFPFGKIMYAIYRKNTVFNLSLASNIRIPTLNDLFWSPGGNPGLQPERTYDLSFSVSSRLLRLTVYAMHVDGWIQWLPTEYHFWKPYNYGTVNSVGSELFFSWQKNIAKTLLFKLDGNMTYNKILSGINRPFYQPEFMCNSRATVTRKNVFADFRFSYSSERQAGFSVVSPLALEAYWLADLRFGVFFHFQKMQINLILEANNIFNTTYSLVPYRPMPGRNFGMSVKLKYK